MDINWFTAHHENSEKTRGGGCRKVLKNGCYETELTYRKIPRPAIVQLFYDTFSQVDVHDHYRQGILELERLWSTKRWYHRLYATMLGIIITDSFFAYRYDAKLRNGDYVDFNTFLGRLAHNLINNSHLNVGAQRRAREEEGDGENIEEVRAIVAAFSVSVLFTYICLMFSSHQCFSLP
jgi:hypothetical protein